MKSVVDLVTIVKGKKHTENINSEGYRYIQIEDLTNDYNTKFTTERGIEVERNDVIIAWDGANAGRVGTKLIGTLGSTLARLRPMDKNIDGGFLFRYLQSQESEIKSKRTGATIPHVNGSSLRSMPIPLPPLPTQQKIAAILDEADALRRKDKELLKKYDELLQSVFYSIFGDPVKNEKAWVKLNGEEYCDKLTVGVVIRPASYYRNDGVIALRSLNIKPNRIDLSSLVYFSKEVNETVLSKSVLRDGDVVFVRTGSTGTAAIIPKELDGCNCIDLIITRPKKGVVNPLYLVYFFNSDFAKKVVSSKEVGGIQKHFNIGAIKSLKIPVPDIELQNDFATIVKNIEEQKAKLITQQQQSEGLFQSLLQRAFKGELVG